MIYDDGVSMNNDQKVNICPRCENEIMSGDAEYCKICGLRLYNYCLGERMTDPNGNYPDYYRYHKNDSDARFCESCGAPTTFFEENILESWEKLWNRLNNHAETSDDDLEDLSFLE